MKKITDLPQLTLPEGSDVIAIVDVSTNTTKYVTRQDLLRDAVDTVDIKDLAVTTGKIANNAITADKLATNIAVYAYGAIAASTADGVKTLQPAASVGITFNGSNTYTATVKGIYMVHAQQLFALGASAIYLMIQKNGVTTRHAYIPGNTMADAVVTDMVQLNVGDTLRIYQGNAANTAWEAQHSGFVINLITRLP